MGSSLLGDVALVLENGFQRKVARAQRRKGRDQDQNLCVSAPSRLCVLNLYAPTEKLDQAIRKNLEVLGYGE
ncbi:hypothetical protein Pan14r_02890 [Crateriforma conspicua]|uniref:Uncharacterized protein n=1 Tax=Crateriforma conspicua TaxID=2527996 RepID=A0A5C5Y079_9PLAN|nr:hypothetical protein Pan14r_02890 [Crateriforma conspicua]